MASPFPAERRILEERNENVDDNRHSDNDTIYIPTEDQEALPISNRFKRPRQRQFDGRNANFGGPSASQPTISKTKSQMLLKGLKSAVDIQKKQRAPSPLLSEDIISPNASMSSLNDQFYSSSSNSVSGGRRQQSTSRNGRLQDQEQTHSGDDVHDAYAIEDDQGIVHFAQFKEVEAEAMTDEEEGNCVYGQEESVAYDNAPVIKTSKYKRKYAHLLRKFHLQQAQIEQMSKALQAIVGAVTEPQADVSEESEGFSDDSSVVDDGSIHPKRRRNAQDEY